MLSSEDTHGQGLRQSTLGDAALSMKVMLADGARIVITTDESVEGDGSIISTTYPALPVDVRPGVPSAADRAHRTGLFAGSDAVGGGRA